MFFPGGKKVHGQYKGFTVKTDQPKRNGGDGEDLSPFDLFIASLGTCTGFFVLRFCQEREISIEGLQMILRTHRDEGKKIISKVEVEITLPLGFPKKYKKAIIAAANSCTVKKHLFEPPIFEVTAVLAQGD